MPKPSIETTDYIHIHFECPLRLPLYDVFKSVPDLCFIGLFAVLGKAKYHYRPFRASKKILHLTFDLDGQTNGQTLPNVLSPLLRGR